MYVYILNQNLTYVIFRLIVYPWASMALPLLTVTKLFGLCGGSESESPLVFLIDRPLES